MIQESQSVVNIPKRSRLKWKERVENLGTWDGLKRESDITSLLCTLRHRTLVLYSAEDSVILMDWTCLKISKHFLEAVFLKYILALGFQRYFYWIVCMISLVEYSIFIIQRTSFHDFLEILTDGSFMQYVEFNLKTMILNEYFTWQ